MPNANPRFKPLQRLDALRAWLWQQSLLRRARRAGASLPPSAPEALDVAEKADRLWLLRSFEQHGPIFQTQAADGLWICLLGLNRSRRLLAEHSPQLRAMTLDLRALFPLGFLRGLEDEPHRHYRRRVVQAIRQLPPTAQEGAWQRILTQGLQQFQQVSQGSQPGPEALARTTLSIATDALLALFFGAEPGQPLHAALRADFAQLGPQGLVWPIGPAQQAAFEHIRQRLRQQLALMAYGTAAEPSHLLQASTLDGEVDETLLGNFIYMVEMGRHDLQGLLRWLLFHASNQPQALERIALAPATAQLALSEAFALEALRMDQSERIQRLVLQDFVFDGFFIPRGAQLRLCMWESHKRVDHFRQPMEFQPERFAHDGPSASVFSPFGLDHHQCPFGQLSVRMAASFVQALACGFTLAASTSSRQPTRGLYRWEPPQGFEVQLSVRQPRFSPG